MLSFKNIDFRNCRYQGQTLAREQPEPDLTNSSLTIHNKNYYQPQGEGILIDDQLRFIIGFWNKGQLHGNSLIFDSHQKYIYGFWREGVPDGINVYRSGETILIASFEQGVIVDHLLVIFEAERIMLTVKLQKNEARVVQRRENIVQDDIAQAAKQIGFTDNIGQLSSLIKFVERSYGKSASGVQLTNHNKLHYLGIQKGLGILFDDDNFIHKVGHISNEMSIQTIGGVYSRYNSKEGDFQNEETVQYKNESRPIEVLKDILKQSHLRSINFNNQYLLTKIPQIFEYINEVLKQQIIPQLVQNQLCDSKRFNIQDINDSLEYHQKDNSENERLRKMRAELYLAIGRPGSEIKPVKRQIIDQFLADQDDQRRQKYEKHNLLYNFKKNRSTIYDTPDRDRTPTARFQMVDYRRSSPVRMDRSRNPSSTYLPIAGSNRLTALKVNKNIQKISRIPSRSPSRSPLKYRNDMDILNTVSYAHLSNLSTGPTATIGTKSTATFGNKQSSNIVNSTQIKYQDVKQRRARLLSQYKDIGHKSSPPKLSPVKIQEHTLYDSPYRDLKGSKYQKKHQRRQSTDIKTISRRIQRPEGQPSRSPQKYSYLSSFV